MAPPTDRRPDTVPRLRVGDLTVGYGGPAAVRSVSLHVAPGEAVALLGRNGAGKTTTLLATAGALRTTTGRVEIDGTEVSGRPSFQVARHGLSLVPQGRRIFPTLSVRENLTLGGRRGDLDAVYGLFPVLRERPRLPGTALSGGEQQMLAIGRALMTRPRILLMDEPSEGLAPPVVRVIG
ncbi:MAG TPA: ATP-binding cassette domain-containing protein, partial [Candidatus Eisenbacteria bacterium]|nr:ATP-binding cassette domain-containing protein [Candidatus Eisenbacteria bacterium]